MTRKHWQRYWSGLLVLGLSTAPRLALGGAKLCDPLDKSSCVQAVHKGDTVPYTGHLLTPRRSAIIASAMENCRNWTEMDKAEANETCKGQQVVWRLLLESERDARRQTEEVLMRRIDKLVGEAPKWYEHPWVVSAISVVATTTLWIIFW
jgi:hypothetical protein